MKNKIFLILSAFTSLACVALKASNLPPKVLAELRSIADGADKTLKTKLNTLRAIERPSDAQRAEMMELERQIQHIQNQLENGLNPEVIKCAQGFINTAKNVLVQLADDIDEHNRRKTVRKTIAAVGTGLTGLGVAAYLLCKKR